MKDKKIILDVVIMALCGALVALLCTSFVNSEAKAKEEAIKALIGDAEVTVAEGHAQGFAGDIAATVSYAGDIIVDLSVTNEAETPNIGGTAIATLKDQILAAHTFEGIDVVSGATYSSNGLFDAIRDAMGIEVYVPTDEELFGQAALEMLPGSTALETELAENVLAVWADGSGKYVVFTQGVGHYPDNPFKMGILLDEKGAVQNMTVVYSHETDGFGTEVLNDKYWQQYFGAATITMKSGGEGTKIDAVSGATETSEGLYRAVKAAFAQFALL